MLGVGYLVQRCGTSQAAIAWPDRGCEHFNADDLERNGVEAISADQEGWHVEGSPLIGQATSPDEPLPRVLPMKSDWYESVWTEADKAADPASRIPVGTAVYKNAVFYPRPSDEEQAVTETAPKAPESPENAGETLEEQPVTEAQAIRNYLAEHGTGVTNKEVVAALKAKGINVTSSQVSAAKSAK